MKIDKLILENFRIFQEKTIFDFKGKKVLVINGSNGHGKSSIFDAIQWCFTGKIPRYLGSSEYQKFNFLINEFANRKDSVTMQVEIWLHNDKKSYKINRSLTREISGGTPNQQIKINEKRCRTLKDGEKKIREILVDDEIDDINKSNDNKAMNLSTFLSSTQLLSQDDLAEFVRHDKPSERFLLIEKVLGLKKYGEEFEAHLKLTETIIYDNRKGFNEHSNEMSQEIERISFQLKEKESIHKLSGEVIESEFVKKINDYLKVLRFDFINDIFKPFKQINDGCLLNINLIKSKLRDHMNNNENIVLLIKNGIELLGFSQLEYHNQLEPLIRSEEKLTKLLVNYEISNEKAVGRQDILETMDKRRLKYQKLILEINNAQLQLLTLDEEKKRFYSHLLIEQIIKKHKTIEVFIDIFNTWMEEIKPLTIRFEQIKKEEVLEDILVKIHNQIIKIDKLQDEKFPLVEELSSVDVEINKLTNETTEKKNLMIDQLIHQVQSSLINDDNHKSCPICGTSNFKNSNTLQESIQYEWNKTNEKLTKIEVHRRDITTRQKHLQAKIAEINSQLKLLEKDKETFIQQKNLLSTEIENIKIKLSPKWLEISKDEIITQKEDTEKYISENKVQYGLCMKMNDNISKKKDIKNKIKIDEQSIAEIKQLSGRWVRYLEMDDKSLNLIKNKYRTYITKREGNILLQKGELTKVRSQIKQLNQKWAQRDQKITQITNRIPNFKGTIEDANEWLEKLTLQNNESVEIDIELSQFITQIQSFLSKDQLKKLRNQLASFNIQKNQFDSKVIENDQLLYGISLIRDRHKQTQSNLMGEYLLDYSEQIDQLFMQISPHSIYRHINLIPKEKDLYIVMSEKNSKEKEPLYKLTREELKKRFNASLTFSSAQANILALCIFLTLNKSQQWTKLKFLGIDDPFQNLDDINAYSFIDVLSHIAFTGKKQIIISTHSDNFASLISSKIGVLQEEIGVISLKSYSESGVLIESNCVI